MQDIDGNNLNGNFNITLKLYDVATGGTALWTEVNNDLQIENGLANITLGETTALNLPFDTPYWLEIIIGESEPLPRIKISSVPYSLYSAKSSNVIQNESFILKDSTGITRIVFDPNAGSFKMMNNDTVWYEINVHSPKQEIEKQGDNYVVTNTIAKGQEQLYYNSDGNLIKKYTHTNELNSENENIATKVEETYSKNPETNTFFLAKKVLEENTIVHNGNIQDNTGKIITEDYNSNGGLIAKQTTNTSVQYDPEIDAQCSFYTSRKDNYDTEGNLLTYIVSEKFTNAGIFQEVNEFYKSDGTIIKREKIVLGIGESTIGKTTENFNENGQKVSEISEAIAVLDGRVFKTIQKFFNPDGSYKEIIKTETQSATIDGKVEEEINNYDAQGNKTAKIINVKQNNVMHLPFKDIYTTTEKKYAPDGFFAQAEMKEYSREPAGDYNEFKTMYISNIKNSLNEAIMQYSETIQKTTSPGETVVSTTKTNYDIDRNMLMTETEEVNGKKSYEKENNNGVYTYEKNYEYDDTYRQEITIHRNQNGATLLNVKDKVNFANLSVLKEVSGPLATPLSKITQSPASIDLQADNINITGMPNITGPASIDGNLTVNGNQVVNGNSNINGDQTVSGTKSFRIDHPDDPENKYLLHSCIESDEVLNQYSGNTTTNENGIAVVNLPDYIQKINIDFRYQLTVIGDFAQAIISKEISNNQFEIKTDKPNIKVSWLITAKRNDEYMKQHPFEPVRSK